MHAPHIGLLISLTVSTPAVVQGLDRIVVSPGGGRVPGGVLGAGDGVFGTRD